VASVSIETRMELAIEYSHKAKRELAKASEHPDPVEQRRGCVRAAKLFQMAADELSDQGRLSE
jgi:hypothetical protein